MNRAIRSRPGSRSQAARKEVVRLGRPERVTDRAAGHHVEQGRGVAHRPRQRAVGREADRVAVHRGAGDPAARRLEPDDPAAARRDPDRAAAVGALGDRHQPGGDRRRRAAARAARHPGGVPRRHGRRGTLGLGVAGRAELRGARLAQADHPRRRDPAHDLVVEVGDEVGEHRRPEAGAHARGRVEVLDRRRHAGQRAVAHGCGAPRGLLPASPSRTRPSFSASRSIRAR